MSELLIAFDDCFLSFLKRKTLLSKHKNNFIFCSKVLLKYRKGHFRTPKFQKNLGEAECFGYALTCQSLRPRPFKRWFCPQPPYFQTCSAATDSVSMVSFACPKINTPRASMRHFNAILMAFW